MKSFTINFLLVITLKTVWECKLGCLGWADTDRIKGEKTGPKYNKCGFSH